MNNKLSRTMPNKRLLTISRTPANKLLFAWAGNFETCSDTEKLSLLDRMRAALDVETKALLEGREIGVKVTA